MRKREIQSFTLKLSDLHDYEVLRLEKKTAKMLERNAEIEANSFPSGSNSSVGGGTSGVGGGQPAKPPLVKYGPKSKQEIRGRLGFLE